MTDPERDLDTDHRRPDDASDDLVAAVGSMSEAMECIERARGRLFDFHQITGHAHLLLMEAAEKLRGAGATDDADLVEKELAGLNVLAGRWTFQIIEEYENGYYSTMKAADQRIRDNHMAGRRHVYEAEMKQRWRTAGRPGHEATPDEAGDPPQA